MWKDDNDLIMDLIDESNKNNKTAPYICPICNTINGHVFYYKHNDNKIGSGWQWCSNCKQFMHIRCIIPNWWINLQDIPIENLSGEPEFLDNNNNLIDNWINKLHNN